MDGKQASRGIYDPAAGLRVTETPAAETVALLPGLNTEYKAAGFTDNEVSRLVLIMGKDGFRLGHHAYITLQYVHIGIGQFGFTANGQVFSFVFSDIQPKLVTVHGRNLLRIFDYIGLRRMPWIRQTDRDFRAVDGVANNEPIITLIEISDWLRKELQAVSLTEALAVHQE
jgi:hypothetical protein